MPVCGRDGNRAGVTAKFALSRSMVRSRMAVWRWVLMSNHVHLVLVTERPDALRAALSKVHRAYPSSPGMKIDVPICCCCPRLAQSTGWWAPLTRYPDTSSPRPNVP